MVGDCKGVAQISGVLDVKVLHTQDLLMLCELKCSKIIDNR